MKTHSKKLLSVALSILLVLSAFAGFSPWVTHVSAATASQDKTIHYLHDMPRLFSDEDLSQQFGTEYNIASTTVWLTEDNLENQVDQGLFAALEPEDVLIIEIKEICPTVRFFELLYDSVLSMLDGSVCVLLIMPFDLDQIENGFDYTCYGITAYYQCNDDFLLFAQLMLEDMLARNGEELSGARLLIDRWFIGSYQNVMPEEWTFYGLIQQSSFLRAFFQALDEIYGITGESQPWYIVGDEDYYLSIQEDLRNRNFQIYINYADDQYVPAFLPINDDLEITGDPDHYASYIQTWVSFDDLAPIGIHHDNVATSLFVLRTVPSYHPNFWNFITHILGDEFDFYEDSPAIDMPLAVYGWVLEPTDGVFTIITLWDMYPEYEGRLLEDWWDAMAFLHTYIPMSE